LKHQAQIVFHLFHYIPVFYGLFELILSQFCHSRYSGKARVLI
jgi:hypothetical protein